MKDETNNKAEILDISELLDEDALLAQYEESEELILASRIEFTKNAILVYSKLIAATEDKEVLRPVLENVVGFMDAFGEDSAKWEENISKVLDEGTEAVMVHTVIYPKYFSLTLDFDAISILKDKLESIDFTNKSLEKKSRSLPSVDVTKKITDELQLATELISNIYDGVTGDMDWIKLKLGMRKLGVDIKEDGLSPKHWRAASGSVLGAVICTYAVMQLNISYIAIAAGFIFMATGGAMFSSALFLAALLPGILVSAVLGKLGGKVAKLIAEPISNRGWTKSALDGARSDLIKGIDNWDTVNKDMQALVKYESDGVTDERVLELKKMARLVKLVSRSAHKTTKILSKSLLALGK